MANIFHLSIIILLTDIFFGHQTITDGAKPDCKRDKAGCIKAFLKKGLERHNELRAQHNCVPLIADPKIDKVAQAYAEKLIKEDKFEHSKGSGFGENLYSFWSSEPTTDWSTGGVEACRSWYNEICLYDFGKGKINGAGHFTQLVWNASTHLGQGIAFSHNWNKYIVVANYKPYGNIVNPPFMKKNVPLPKKPTVKEICKKDWDKAKKKKADKAKKDAAKKKG